jgi:hypothetical protein
MCSGVIPRWELVSIFVTLTSRKYKGGQGSLSKQKIIRSFYIKGNTNHTGRRVLRSVRPEPV